MEAKAAAWNLGRSFQRFAKNTAARRGQGLRGLVGQQESSQVQTIGPRPGAGIGGEIGGRRKEGHGLPVVGSTAPTAEGYFGPRGGGGREGPFGRASTASALHGRIMCRRLKKGALGRMA